MELVVDLTEGAADDFESLYEWLRSEEVLRGRVKKLPASAAPEEMGGLSDIMTVALGGGGALTVLANSISVWIRHHRSDIRIRVAVRPSGRVVEVNASNVGDAEALLRQAMSTDIGG